MSRRAICPPCPQQAHLYAVCQQLDAAERALLEGASLADAAWVAEGARACDERPTVPPPAVG